MSISGSGTFSTQPSSLPVVIQGGMGVGVSDWRLARAVAMSGQMGVVSGTALDVVLARRLQLGDPEGHVRRALSHFPVAGAAERIMERYFVPGGKPADMPFKSKPLPSEAPSHVAEELLVAGNFVEVFLAREGHDGLVGINYLEKLQTPTLPSLYGAILAGVSCVLMGAGIPRAIPGVLDRLARNEPAELPLYVEGAKPDETFMMRFDPREFWPEGNPVLKRPDFYAIISSATLANVLAKKASGKVNGFIVEGSRAGGHNAPPRGPMQLNAEGEPIYGERDVADLTAIAALGLPFWLAGSYARPERVAQALKLGAAGVQVGTAFAYCEESGFTTELKQKVLSLSQSGQARVLTDPLASPTGFPFKIVQVEGTRSDAHLRERAAKNCDLGYLRQAYKKPDNTVGWRCAAEKVDDFLQKGGTIEQTQGRMCLCNGLLANIGLGQVRRDDGSCSTELPLLTSGDDVADIARFLKPGETTYTAAEVVDYLLRDVMAEKFAANV